MSRGTWRDRARPRVAEALGRAEGLEGEELRRSLRGSYPWPPRSGWPYRVWLDELKVQRGLKPVRRYVLPWESPQVKDHPGQVVAWE